ncbi:hypothetical protein C8Q72DRAFT_799367 [Fomitopsis betulina]|nr:hypothetical protein C8Q72DRAFT_799367 [Fomitopsis betulina]
MSEKLKYDNTYWNSVLPPEKQPQGEEEKLHLIISLLVYLGLSLSKVLHFVFTSQIKSVKERAGVFLSVRRGAGMKERFPPAEIFGLWNGYSPSTLLKQLTIAGLLSILDPGTITERLQLLAPFLYDFLMAYTAAPNCYRRVHMIGWEGMLGSLRKSGQMLPAKTTVGGG